jgi:DNA-binding response OmpR family regulator
MLRLLVVDDEIDVCDFVRSFFKERNFEVFVAYNGQEALTLVATRNPHIIILDLRMPVMDGMAMMKELHKAGSEAKVIMVTAVEDAEREAEARKYGVVEYLNKPIILEQLERTVFMLAEKIRMQTLMAPKRAN